jgi:UDP-N-acetylmuramate dehydrogenase
MISVRENVPLSDFSTFHIGGPARFFAVAKHAVDVAEALRFAKERDLSIFVLGGGSNILFADRGFDGLVIKFEYRDVRRDGTILVIGGGARLLDAVEYACHEGLGGLELLAGIPGTVGGAVRGNAGAFGVEMGTAVSEVEAFDTQTLQSRALSREDCAFSYRQSIFKKREHLLVLSVRMHLHSEDAATLSRTARETIAKREAKHPQQLSCAGSFFMNPKVADERLLEEFFHESGVAAREGKLPAGWLIDHVGLRGKRIGGAQVSELHPNYILNTGHATAEDVIILASVIKQRIRTQLSVHLKEEVQMVGF